MLPSEFLKLDRYERAFIVAAIQIKIEADKELSKKMK
jgi:hypothetical protein